MKKLCAVCGKPVGEAAGLEKAEVSHGACVMENAFRKRCGGVVPWFLVVPFLEAQEKRAEQISAGASE